MARVNSARRFQIYAQDQQLQTQPFPSSDYEDSAASTAASEEKSYDSKAETHIGGLATSTYPPKDSLPYVQLDPEYMRYSCWTNDPNRLYLSVDFDKNNPNLADDFNVDSLQPVVKEKVSDQFVLRHAKLRWYLWDAWEGELLRVNEMWTTGFDSNEDIVANVLSQSNFIDENAVAIWRDRKED